MFTYIVRVELKGSPSAEIYDALHEAMRIKGYLQTIKNMTSNAVYSLPHAEYARQTIQDLSSDSVRTEVHSIVKYVYDNYQLLVTKANAGDVAWWLHPIK